MRFISALPVVLLGVILIGCGGPDLSGSWRLTSVDCGGVSAQITGITHTFEIEGDVAASTTSVVGCSQTVGDIPITTGSDGSISINNSAGGSVTCDPDSCGITITTSTSSSTLWCPDDLPVAGLTYNDVEVNGDEMTADASGCDHTWVRAVAAD